MPSREILSNFVLEAKRGKKRKNKGKGGDAAKRSRFLGVVMKHLSSDAGKAMANAIEEENIDKFKNLWGKATNAIINDLEQKFGKTNKAEPKSESTDGNANIAV